MTRSERLRTLEPCTSFTNTLIRGLNKHISTDKIKFVCFSWCSLHVKGYTPSDCSTIAQWLTFCFLTQTSLKKHEHAYNIWIIFCIQVIMSWSFPFFSGRYWGCMEIIATGPDKEVIDTMSNVSNAVGGYWHASNLITELDYLLQLAALYNKYQMMGYVLTRNLHRATW